ncbi:ion transport protein [Chloropicon primus]|uniref:Ion transport protein n=1 Tax=Chloropicon primus TaxID=1764295 RepID=A0A5B8MPB6_9CHLO|nr:ion transport protein [Chloropicon primus]UPR00404.1 ion transport protein [Chloropicon primus]|eukprot:QDZ21190.1 ion transport protein [Chloropicon primus]
MVFKRKTSKPKTDVEMASANNGDRQDVRKSLDLESQDSVHRSLGSQSSLTPSDAQLQIFDELDQIEQKGIKAAHQHRRSSNKSVSIIEKMLNRDDDQKGIRTTQNVFKQAIDPRNTSRLRWDFVIVLAVLYNCLVIPLRIGFGDDKFGPFSAIDLLIDLMFMSDIFVNFVTGYFRTVKETGEQQLVLSQPAAAYHYARTWFFFDTIASLPVDFMLLLQVSPKVLLYMRFPRMLRLLRLPRLFRYMKRWEEYIGLKPQVLRLCKTIFLLFVFAHFSACIQFFAAQLQDFPADCWVAKAKLVQKPKMEQYAYSLFTALSHMLCIGYGPTAGPTNLTEVWLITISMCIGASFYIILVGMISSTLVDADQNRSRGREGVRAMSVSSRMSFSGDIV